LAKKNVALDEKGYRKFGIRDSVAYAAGDLGCNMSFALKSTMAIFWTQFMGLDLWYSLLLIIVQVWDAINDPLIGSMIDSDRHQYKRNKFLQYIWAGSIGLIVGGACCFLPFPNAPVAAKYRRFFKTGSHHFSEIRFSFYHPFFLSLIHGYFFKASLSKPKSAGVTGISFSSRIFQVSSNAIWV